MKIRKAILTGGGRATRLRPITHTKNKHLIPLANRPMIFHAIEKAVEAGISEIYINMNPGEAELPQIIGDGGHWGIKIEFFEQEGGPQGIAHVVKCAEKFIGSEPFMFYLSDNIFLGSLKPIFEHFEQTKADCMLAFAKVPDPERFGVPVFNGEGALIDILEKPANPPNNFAQTGIYLYGPKIFFETFNQIEKSARGEYEISSIHSYLLKNNKNVRHQEVTGWWKDTGKPEDLILANALILDQMPDEKFKISGTIDQSVKICGNVGIGLGTTAGPGVIINGPVIIGENCTLKNCELGPHTTIGSGCTVKGGAELTNSIILGNSTIDCPLKIKDSIIGERVNLVDGKNGGSYRLIIGDHAWIEV